MLGYFLFGGSDFVILFQSEFDFKMTVKQDDNGNYKHVLTGEEYGKLNLKE